MATTDTAEFTLFATDLTTKLAILPVVSSHLYLENCEAGSGAVTIPLDSTAAGLVTIGMFVACSYRGSYRFGFFVDDMQKVFANSQEEGGKLLSISGRGALALLDDAIVWDDGTNTTSRTFTTVTMASILLTLISEAVARGGLATLSDDFSPTVDSDSVAWTDSDTYTFSVGTSLMEVVRQFVSTASIEFRINLSGGGFVLSAYKGLKGTDLSETIFFRTGMNCEEAAEDSVGTSVKNVVRTAFQDGFVTASDSTSITAYRRKETFVDAGVTTSTTLAAIIGNAELAQNKDPQKTISLKIYDGVNPRLFLDYTLGDYVMLDIEGTETKYRVLGIQADFNGDVFCSIVVECNTIFRTRAQRQQAQIDRLRRLITANSKNDGSNIYVNQWFGLGMSGDTTNGFVLASIIDTTNRCLYVGGTFTKIGGVTAAKIAKYNLETGVWSSIGGLLNDYVDAFAINAGVLYVGGKFTNANGEATADCITTYTIATNTWATIGGGIVGIVQALAVDSGVLYVGGTFLNANAIAAADRLAKYTIATTTWAAVTPAADYLNSGVRALHVASGVLWIGGDFTDDANPAHSQSDYVLKYTISGGAWTAYAGKLNASVFALHVLDGILYIGGDFTNANGVAAADKLVAYNIAGNTWAALGDFVFNDTVYTLATDGFNHLLVGGLFTAPTLYPSANYFARYSIDGLGWTSLDPGFDDQVATVNYYGTMDWVFAGGKFATVSGVSSKMLAVYISSLPSALEFILTKTASAHPPITIGTPANGLSVDDNQVLSLALAGAATIGAVSASAQTFAGVKTFSSDPLIPDEAYDATTWDGSLEPPTKNAVRDKIETVVAGAIGGTGVVGQVAEFVTNTKTLQAAKIIGPAANILTITNSAASTLALAITSAKTLTLTATDNFNLTIPATGTAALLATQNAFSDLNTFNIAGYGKIMSFGAAVSYEVGYFSYDSGTGQFRLYGSPYGALGLYSQANKDVVLVPGTGQVKAEVTNAAANAQSTVLNAAALLTQTSSGNFNNYGLVADVAFSLNTGVTNTESQIGFIGGINVSAAHLGTQTYIIALQPTNTLLNGAGGVITTAIGNRVRGLTYAGTVTTAVTNVYGEKIETPTFGGGTLANIYGLYLEDQTGASTLNFAIYTNAGQVRIGDDLFFAGAGSGLPYGGCSASDMATPFSQAATQNTWYAITDAEISASPLNLMTHSNGVLTITKAGTYLVIWAVEVDSSIANKHVSVGISIDAAAPAFHQSILVVPTTEEVLLTGTRVLSVTAGQTLGLALRTTDTGTPTLTCAHLSLSVVMVGG